MDLGAGDVVAVRSWCRQTARLARALVAIRPGWRAGVDAVVARKLLVQEEGSTAFSASLMAQDREKCGCEDAEGKEELSSRG